MIIKKEYRQFYACCSDIPESLLSTGESNNYSKWYINYIRGIGKKELPQSAKKFLMLLSNQEWHKKINVGVGTILGCLELELVEEERIKINDNSFYSKFKITGRGNNSLIENSLP